MSPLRCAVLPLLAMVIAACSSQSEEGPASEDRLGGPTGRADTEIRFGSGAVFPARSCTLTLRYEGAANTVQVAGEFTGWGDAPVAMTRRGNAFEAMLVPSATLRPGELYGYKLIVDGQWRSDATASYRKIVGGQMNPALQLPTCAAGPELRSERVDVQARGERGHMQVKVHVQASSTGARPTLVRASLDRGALPKGSWTVDDASGSVRFDVDGLAKGKHTVSLRAVDEEGHESEPVDLPFWVEDEAFDWRDGALYMFMVDRFANGNAGNDRPVGAPVHYDADWHGGDLEGALKVMQSGYFEKLGVRTIWLSPLNEQTSNYHSGDGNQLFSAYHGYWPTKARSAEPRFGGDAALRAFVAEAHKRGLRVLLDLINNQVHKDHEYVAPQGEWFRTACQCGTPGCGWSEKPFECLFQPYLPDIDWTRPGAEKQFVADAVNWISEFDLDGFRVDAVKHVESNSVYNMRAELARRFEQGGARIFMVGETAVGRHDSGTFFGETFTDGYDWIDSYTGKTGLDGQFDFPTRHEMADGLVSGTKPLSEVEAAIHTAETRYKPDSLHVRFLNGHDNPRIASIAASDPKLGCTWSSGCRDEQLPPLAYSDPAVYSRLRRALTVLYSLPGVPYLYMGDEVAFGGGADPDMRRNMLFTETELQGVQMAKPGSAPPALTEQQVALRDWVRQLGATRASTRALRRGHRVTLVGNDPDFWVYAYQSGPKEIAVVALNRGNAPVTRNVTTAGLDVAGVTTWTTAVGGGSAATRGGSLSVTLGAGEAAIFVAAK